jgi:glyoxylase-like metal-dependent hydrolase (beta-lactamase superfamily II)
VSLLVWLCSHKDHIGSATIFGKQVQTISSVAVADELKVRKDPARPPPKITFRSKRTFMFGGLKVQLSDIVDAHDDGNVLAYLPQHKVAVFVDVVYAGALPCMASSGSTRTRK